MTSGFNNKENLTIQPRARTCKSRPSPLWWGGGRALGVWRWTDSLRYSSNHTRAALLTYCSVLERYRNKKEKKKEGNSHRQSVLWPLCGPGARLVPPHHKAVHHSPTTSGHIPLCSSCWISSHTHPLHILGERNHLPVNRSIRDDTYIRAYHGAWWTDAPVRMPTVCGPADKNHSRSLH